MLNYIERRQAKAEMARRIAVMGGRRGHRGEKKRVAPTIAATSDYNDLTKSEISDLLDAKGIEHDIKMKKPELIEMLKGGD